ncbi:hypothetical protein NE237_022842 [Protea cynaroides]|uniref:Fatty acyl-CoA reductase n=1 Tax=Protea cynaroides TaxID=273540 RepID=A0A9Q0HDU0_9MAGN|nr:hypothetical protein NE237_022842 [Protea cynaroides]
MDFGSMVKSLQDKSILITGTSGFLAKIFMEKVLRSQPKVKKLFICLEQMMIHLLHNDCKMKYLPHGPFQSNIICSITLLGKKVFRDLKKEHGTDSESFILNKVIAIAGDISFENLGIKDSTLKDEMWKEISFIFNVAGNTTFDERVLIHLPFFAITILKYDVALSINALGVKHICEFAKKCTKLEYYFTAYITREKEGIILEKRFQVDETFGGNHSLDVAAEKKVVHVRLKARLFGWANIYVFTKAIGEMLIGHLRGDLPVVILCPTIITSTYQEPFPGWIEGFRTIDSLIVSYGKGKLNHFLADPEAPLDVVPGDMVVNAMLASMAAHCRQRSEFIYHVSTSKSNPMKNNELVDYIYRYLFKNPCLGRDGMPIKVTRGSLLPTKASFNNLMTLHYKLPIQVLRIMNALSFQTLENQYRNLNRKYNLIIRFVELYEHFSLFKARNLRVMSIKDDNITSMKFYLDPKCINWEDYFVNIHIHGLVQHSIK